MKNVYLAVISYLLAATMAPVFSQQWNKSTIYYGRDVNAVKIFSPNNVLVVGGHLTNDSIQTIDRTTNSGLSWDFTDIISSWLTATDFTDSLNGFAVGTNGKIMVTHTGGAQWTYLSSPLNRDFNKVIMFDSLTAIIAGGSNAGSMQTVLKTTDGGNNWTVLLDQPGKWLKGLFFTDAATGYAVGDSGTILKTTDGGNNWAPQTAPIVRNFNAVWFTTADTGIIVGGDVPTDVVRTILRTTNAGNTWNIITSDTSSSLNDVYFLNTDTGYATGKYAALLKTVNGGLNWAAETVSGAQPYEEFRCVRFKGSDYGVIGGSNGSFYVYATAQPVTAYTTGSAYVDSTQALLKGSINTHNAPAVYSFSYSTDSNFSFYLQTNEVSIQNNSFANVQQHIFGLTPNTHYYYFLKTQSLAGVQYGDTLSFYTGTDFQALNTNPATNITSTAALLNGAVQGFTFPVNLSFNYGTTPGLGNTVAGNPALVNDTALHTVSASLNALQPNTIYYYQLMGQAGYFHVPGNIVSFYTGTPNGTLLLTGTTNLTDSSACVNAIINNFHVPVTLSFDYSPNAPVFNYTMPAAPAQISDTVQHSVATCLSSLLPGTNYFYRLKAETAFGTYYSDTSIFYTVVNHYLETLTPTNISDTTASFHGIANPFGYFSHVYFEYGPGFSFSQQVSAVPDTISGSINTFLAASVTGLTQGVQYSYRIKMTNTAGTFYSQPVQFFADTNPIPNFNFESWNHVTDRFPAEWIYLGNVTKAVSYNSSTALHLFGNTDMPGGMSGVGVRFGGGIGAGGVPFTARPDSVILFANYNIASGDTGWIILQLRNAGNDIGGVMAPITGNTGGSFQRKSFPVSYSSGVNPDTTGFAIISTNLVGMTFNALSWIMADDVSFAGTTQNIPGYNFETWDSLQYDAATGWIYKIHETPPNLFPFIPYTKTTDAYAGTYAIRFQNIKTNNFKRGGYITTNVNNTGTMEPSFPVSHRYNQLNGYFKFLPDGDTLQISVAMFKNGTQIGISNLLIDTATTGYKAFTLPIAYFDSTAIPDAATITINTSFNEVQGNSIVYIDELGFDGFSHSIVNGIPVVMEDLNLFAYPNPANDKLTIELSQPVEAGSFIRLLDLHGRPVKEIKVAAHEKKLKADIADMAAGLYLLQLSSPQSIVTQKIVIER